MYTIIYNLYFFLMRKQKRRKDKGKESSRFGQKLINRIEWFYNVPVRNWYARHSSMRCGINKKRREQKIIVSLTSYPKRIGTIWLTVETLLRQSVKPDKVILWLAESQFAGIESLPEELLRLQKRGLTIRFCEDLRSHKKYFYAMQEYPDSLILLFDDDMLYPYDTIEKLMKLHKKYPDDICTMTAQVMEPDFSSKPSLWRNPKVKERFEHSSDIQVFTGSGSLYPPNVLDDKVFVWELAKQLCPYADDLWLTFMAHRKGTKITAKSPWRAFPITIYGTGEGSLWYVNAEGGQNDAQWETMIKYFEGE